MNIAVTHLLTMISDINECSSNPCLNGAICNDLYNAYECICMSEYVGEHCEYRESIF